MGDGDNSVFAVQFAHPKCRVTCLGTHKGELMGIALTGKQATITMICIDS